MNGYWIRIITQRIDVTFDKHNVMKMSRSIINEFWIHTLNFFSSFFSISNSIKNILVTNPFLQL
jgi:hypothetical protein